MKAPANLKKRLITGGIALCLFTAIIVIDREYEPLIPCLLLLVTLLILLAGQELKSLMTPSPPRLNARIVFPIAFVIGFWLNHLDKNYWNAHLHLPYYPLRIFFIMFSTAVFWIVLEEMMQYQPQTGSLNRVGLSVLSLLYLGVLPCFLLQIRWQFGATVLVATILIPKLGDVAAYFTGSLIGKHPMTPVLSPKKTWEGFAGGMLACILVAVIIHAIDPEPFSPANLFISAAFGFVVGIAGVIGDLFESLIKREAQIKDASQTLPGFGGILDLVDSVLFAAPASYFFLVILKPLLLHVGL